MSFRFLFRLSVFFLSLLSSSQVLAQDDPIGPALQKTMIWADSAPTGNQVYVAFRKPFKLDAVPEKGSLHLFADSRYILWINGQYVERGPCRFDPEAPQYDTIDVTRFLRSGKNVVAVLVHHYHDGSDPAKPADLSGRMMRNPPGLALLLETGKSGNRKRLFTTDTAWRASSETEYLPAPLDSWRDRWGSIPDRIDATKVRKNWMAVDFDDCGWASAVAIDGSHWGPLQSRLNGGIPLLRETEIAPLMRIDPDSGRRQPLGASLPLTLKTGEQILIDPGRFVLAYSRLDFTAEEGTVLEQEYPQNYFDSGKKPAGSHGRVNRYVARSGQQTYESLDTFGCRYWIIRCKSGSATLNQVKLIDRLYPFDVVGRFQSEDEVLNAIWQIGLNTILACSEDGYVDCATRERVEWMADGFMVAYPVTRVALVGPAIDGSPAYGDARLLRNLLRHIGQSQLPDGRVKAHHPSDRWDKHAWIPDYACLWIHGIRDYFERTGDLTFVQEQWPRVEKQLTWFLDRRTEHGLVRAQEFVYFTNPLAYKVCEGTTFNSYLYRALVDAAELARLIDVPAKASEYTDAANRLRQSINTHLWDAKAGTYHGGILDGKKTPVNLHAAFIPLYYGVVPSDRMASVQKYLLAHAAEKRIFPYSHAFLLETLYQIDTDEADRLALKLMRNRWTDMARGETQTTWENFRSGEKCHESGAAPTYFLSAYVLGVRTDGPIARRRLTIEPRTVGLDRAEGTVVTEFGPVPVRWEKSEEDNSFLLETTIPDRVTAEVAVPRLTKKSVLILDGKPEASPPAPEKGQNESDRFLRLKLGPGPHTVRVQ